MTNIIHDLRSVLTNSIDTRPEKVSIFFKTGPGDYAEHDRFIGITVPTVRRIAKSFIKTSLDDLGILIRSEINEERLLALIILTGQYKKSPEEQQEKIYQFYMNHLKYINNWNLVDSSAHLIVGAYLYGKDCSLLEKLASSKNLWERRIAIVATWHFIRNSELEWTFRIANLLLNDEHDLIHKAVGWMLREAGKRDESRLIDFVARNAHKMPKTMLRYSTERLTNYPFSSHKKG
ncbi:MAG: DNA alkylation repair protein [Rickettsiaceae bacterium]|nr:DNA alkylation repair protein [Rickettsiaceae bacterium]